MGQACGRDALTRRHAQPKLHVKSLLDMPDQVELVQATVRYLVLTCRHQEASQGRALVDAGTGLGRQGRRQTCRARLVDAGLVRAAGQFWCVFFFFVFVSSCSWMHGVL